MKNQNRSQGYSQRHGQRRPGSKVKIGEVVGRLEESLMAGDDEGLRKGLQNLPVDSGIQAHVEAVLNVIDLLEELTGQINQAKSVSDPSGKRQILVEQQERIQSDLGMLKVVKMEELLEKISEGLLQSGEDDFS